jgi:hypothetical protein
MRRGPAEDDSEQRDSAPYDLATDGRRSHDFQREVELPQKMLAALRDPYDFAQAFENREFFTQLEERLRAMGRNEALKVMQMYLAGSEHEIAAAFGLPPGRAGYRAKNTFFQKVRRTVREAFQSLPYPTDKNKPAA